jgi:hypothetical protein
MPGDLRPPHGDRGRRGRDAHSRSGLDSERFGTPLYARVDLIADSDGEPRLLELEVIEPELYLAASPGAAERFAAALLAS